MLRSSVRRLATDVKSGARQKRFPIIRTTVGVALVGAGAYTGVAAYALHDEKVRQLWNENAQYTGGQPALDLIQDGINRARNTKLEDVQNAASDTVKNAEKAASDLKQTVSETYEKGVSAVGTVKESVKQNVEVAQKVYENTRDSAVGMYESTKDVATNAYQTTAKVIEQTTATVTSAADTAFKTFESVKESVFGKSTSPEAPKLDPTPQPAVPYKKEAAKPAEKPAVTPNAEQAAPVNKEAAPNAPESSKKAESKPVVEKEKEAPVVAKKEVKPAAKEEKTAKAAPAEKPADKPVPKEAPAAAAAAAVPELLAQEATPSKEPVPVETLLVTEKAEKPATASKEEDKAGSRRKKEKTTDKKPKQEKLIGTRTRDEIDQIINNLAETDPTVAASPFATILKDLATNLDILGSSKRLGDVAVSAQAKLIAIAEQVLAGSNLSSADKDAIAEQAEKFSQLLKHQAEQHEQDINQLGELQQKDLALQAQQLQHGFEKELSEKLSEQLDRFNAALDGELQKQANELERKWNRRAKALVDQERDGRLARLDLLALKLKHLEHVSIDTSDYLQVSLEVRQQQLALSALSAVLSSSQQTPFAKELSVLSKLGKNDELISVTLDTVSTAVARKGIAPLDTLKKDLDVLVPRIRGVQLMPERGGPIAYVFSYALSFLVLPKSGLTMGDDVEAILSRTRYFLQNDDLDKAARELNQLKGWPKKLAADWMQKAREHLEVKQVVEVIDQHLQLRSLDLVF